MSALRPEMPPDRLALGEPRIQKDGQIRVPVGDNHIKLAVCVEVAHHHMSGIRTRPRLIRLDWIEYLDNARCPATTCDLVALWSQKPALQSASKEVRS